MKLAKNPTATDIKDMVEEGRERMNADYEEIGRRIAFALRFKHYRQRDEDVPSRILPKDPGVFRVLRYKASELNDRFPISVRCRPEDDSFGSMADAGCQDVQHSLEDWITRPRNFYKYTRRDVIWGGLTAGVWYARVDYEPRTNRALVTSRDPRWIILPKGFRNPHDPRCPWMIDIDRVPTRIAQKTKNWTGAEKLRPDDGYDLIGQAPDQSNLHPGQVNLLADADGHAWSSTDETTIARCYWRESYATKKAPDEQRPLGEGLGHLKCQNCGFTSPPEAEMGRELNPLEVCPDCGQTAELQLFHGKDVSSYPQGRMTIVAPFQPELETLWDNDWPCEWPSFPFFFFGSYTDPTEYLPQSDASVHRTAAMMSNAMQRLTYEQGMQSKAYWRIPRTGLTNSRRQPFTFSPEDGNVMYDESAMGAMQMTHYPPSPINTSILSLYDRIQGQFKASDGTSDISLDSTQTRDIPVGTIKALTASGNVPLKEHGEMLYDCESFGFGALAETLRVCAASGMDVRHFDRATGKPRFKKVYGAFMPRSEVVVSAGPTLDQTDSENLDTYEKLRATPPPYRRGMARFGKVDQEVLQQLSEDDAEAQRMGIPPPWAPAPMVPPGTPSGGKQGGSPNG